MKTYGTATVAPVEIGDKVKFNPFKGIHISGFAASKETIVKGTVIEIHNDHHWFAVEYELDGVKQRTSFNFADIGEYVTVRKSA